MGHGYDACVPDDFDDLARPEDPSAVAADLAALVASLLGEPADRLRVEPEDDGGEMAWLVRDGMRISRFNPVALSRSATDRRREFAKALAKFARRLDELRGTIDALEIGRRYTVDTKNRELRRTFRSTGVLRDVSPFRPAEGAIGGGWSLTFEVRPRFGRPTVLRVETAGLIRIEPA